MGLANGMDGKALVDSVKREVIEPGIRRLMDSQYFTEMRQGKLSIKRLQGWAIQHYLHNKAILKSFALGMVKNAQDQTMFDYFIYQLNEEQSHPDLAKRFGLALGLKEEDFTEATQIFECQIHSARTVYNTLTGIAPQNRASAMTSESMDAAWLFKLATLALWEVVRFRTASDSPFSEWKEFEAFVERRKFGADL